MSFDEQFEDLLTQVVSEKVDAVMEDHAEDYVRDLIRQTINNALEDMDVCADILAKIRAADVERLVKIEVGAITVRLLKGKLTQMIQDHVRLALESDEFRNIVVSHLDTRVRESIRSPEIAGVLDQLARQAVSTTLQRMSMELFQSMADSSYVTSAERKDGTPATKLQQPSEPVQQELHSIGSRTS